MNDSGLELTVNGTCRTVESIATLADLLKQLEQDPLRVAVEVNGRLVPRASHGETRLQAGDAVEIVSFVGGG